MVVNDDAGILDKRGALKSIAGRPAPTGTAVGRKQQLAWVIGAALTIRSARPSQA
jgi:hypothetical protein